MNFLDICPCDILSKIMSYNCDIIEREIFKLEMLLLQYVSKNDKNILIDIDNDCYEDINPCVNIQYENLTYCMDYFLFEEIEYKKICIVIKFKIEFMITEYSVISPLIKNATYYDVLKTTNDLYGKMMAFFEMYNADSDLAYYEDHRFLECIDPIDRKELKKTKKILNNIPKSKNVVFLEPYFGS